MKKIRLSILLGYKLIDLQKVNLANISLGYLIEGDLKLFDIDKLKSIK